MNNYTLLRRNLKELDQPGLPNEIEDPELLAPPPGNTLYSFQHNPYKERKNFVWQYLSLLGSKIVGHLGLFPIHLRCEGELVDATSGSDLFISEQSRKFGVGINLMEDFFSDMEKEIFVAYGISSMAEPLYRFMGTTIGKVKVLTMLIRSDAKLKFVANGRLQSLAPLVDIGLKAYRIFLNFKLSRIKKTLRIEECAEIPVEVDSILQADRHPYAEWHGHEYLQWLKDYPIYKPVGSRKFFALYHQDEMVGFFMTDEFVENVKHRDKHIQIRRGVVLEWGSKSEESLPENLLVLMALLHFGNRVHTSVLHAHDAPLVDFLTRIGKMRVSSTYNWGLKVGSLSPFVQDKAMLNMDNWRIRTAMGDVGLL